MEANETSASCAIFSHPLADEALWPTVFKGVGLGAGLQRIGSDSAEQNGFVFPVLKHGPRSLTYVRVQVCPTPVRNESDSGLPSPPASIPRENGLSVSIHVGTRKMVNYA